MRKETKTMPMIQAASLNLQGEQGCIDALTELTYSIG